MTNDVSETYAFETIPVIGKLTCWKSFLTLENIRVFQKFSFFSGKLLELNF